MAKKVLIISTSLRGNSNSEILAKECEKGAWDAGHNVEGAVAQGRKPVQQPLFLLSRRKDVENQRQTSKMLKT